MSKVDENVVDREIGLEVLRRGLATRETLLPYAQRRRAEPSRSFAGLLVEAGVLTPELGSELEQLARARAAAAAGIAPAAPPEPPPAAAPPSGSGLGARSPSGNYRKLGPAQTQPGDPGATRPGSTIMDLDAPDDPRPAAPAAPASSTADVDPARFQASRTFVDAAMEVPAADGAAPERTMVEDMEVPGAPPEPQRTMLEAMEMPGAPAEPQRTMLENLEMPPSAPARPQAASKKYTSVAAAKALPTTSEAAALAQGKRFGDYEILSKLGEGAMGLVFKARRASDGSIVALKVMRGGLVANPKIRERFLREAKAARLIDHANVVRFVDAGAIGNDQYLAMEFVEGRSLQSMLNDQQGRPLPFERAAELFRQICSGLVAAHEAGVIHRDLKPENILLTKDREIAKITDFGLARREEESMLLTRPGQIMGSPYYMAPEQGQGLPVDARADLYSLGAILFCLTTGRVPFPYPSATEVIHAHCEAERPDPRSVNPEIPASVAAFNLKLLSIDPDNRPPSAKAALDEFVEAVEADGAPSFVPAPGATIDDLSSKSDDDDVFHQQKVVGAFEAGTRVGKLTIESVIGAGGMGAVYRARHDDGRLSALKVLPKQFASDEKRRKSFLREAELGARIKAPNVVETREYGFDQNQGVAFIELELVEGTSLETMIKTGVLQEESLLINVLRGCAQGLRAMHAAGFLHRDVKPANVLLAGEFLSRPDANVKLIDLGLAIEKKDVGKSGEAGFAGTPTYMAPEQSHKDGVVDERSDLYSLGCTIYHLACGSPPFEGKTPAAIAYQHQRTAPKPPKTLNANLSDAFSAIMEILLAKDPEERHQTADALIADLTKTDADGKLVKPQIHAKYRTNRVGKDVFLKVQSEAPTKPPPKVAIIVAAVVAIVCGLVFIVGIIQSMPSKPAPPEPPPVAPPPPPPPPPPVIPKNTAEEDLLKKMAELGEVERRAVRDKELVEIRELIRNGNLVKARLRAEKLKAADPTAENLMAGKSTRTTIGIYEKLDFAASGFDKAMSDARARANKASKTDDENEWGAVEEELSAAEANISRPGDRERLAELRADIAKLRAKK